MPTGKPTASRGRACYPRKKMMTDSPDEDLDGAVLIEDSDQEDGDVADVHSKEED
jgi:hypothetical protein